MQQRFATEKEVVVRHRGSAGVLAGVLGCVFGLLGIFTIGIVFVPLAALCSFVGFLRGVHGPSASGIGASLLGGVLTFVGFAVSPSLWALLGVAVIAHNSTSQGPSVTSSVSAPRQAPVDPQQFLANLDRLVDAAVRFNAAGNADLRKYPEIEQRYAAITTQVQAYLIQDRRLRNVPDPYAMRDRIYVAMTQSINATEQLHNEVEAAQRDFNEKSVALMKMISDAQRSCEQIRAQSNAANASCIKLDKTALPLRDTFNGMANYLNRLQVAYHNEISRQQRFAQETTQQHPGIVP